MRVSLALPEGKLAVALAPVLIQVLALPLCTRLLRPLLSLLRATIGGCLLLRSGCFGIFGGSRRWRPVHVGLQAGP